MKKIFTPFAIVLIVTAVISGCKNVPPVTSGMGTDKMHQGDQYSKYLQVHNAKLGKQLKITEVKSRKNNDLLEVNLALTSTYKKSLHLQYHFNWFDQDGFVIEPGKASWQPLELHGFGTVSVRGLAPSIKVNSFSVYVREVPEKAYKY